MSATEFAAGIGAMIDHAHTIGGGRLGCCGRGQCATHLAEGDRGHVSTIHLGTRTACFPETEGQTLTAGAAREAYFMGLRVLGLEPDAFVG